MIKPGSVRRYDYEHVPIVGAVNEVCPMGFLGGMTFSFWEDKVRCWSPWSPGLHSQRGHGACCFGSVTVCCLADRSTDRRVGSCLSVGSMLSDLGATHTARAAVLSQTLASA